MAAINQTVAKTINELRGIKTKSRSQMCLIGTNGLTLRLKEIEVAESCAADQETELAFLLDPENQMINREDGKQYQILGEKSIIPIALMTPSSISADENDLKEVLGDIYKLAYGRAKTKKMKEHQNKLWDRFVWIACTAAIVAITLAVLNGF